MFPSEASYCIVLYKKQSSSTSGPQTGPLQGNTQFQQAAALGPNGLTIGPNKVDAPSSEQERQAQGNLGVQNLKIGKDGLVINDGSRLNSSVLASVMTMASTQMHSLLCHWKVKW